MLHCVFIHTNHQQMLGALASRHSLTRSSQNAGKFEVRFIDTKDYDFLRPRDGQSYLRDGARRLWLYDELLENPRGQLMEILGFLGVDNADDRIPADVDDRRNAGRGEMVPPRFEGVLARVLAEEVRSLNARFDNQYTRRWLAYTEERL